MKTKIRLKSFSGLAEHIDRFMAAPADGKQKVQITNHTVERLMDWRRSGKFSTWDAERLLAQIASKGECVGKRPGGTYEVCWQGLYALVRRDGDGALIVLTFNGDREWRNW